MTTHDIFKPGSTVRLKADTSKIGTITDRDPRNTGNNRVRVHVRWHNGGTEYVLDCALEAMQQEEQTVEDIIEGGHYGKSNELRAAITFFRLSGCLDNLIYSLNVTNTQFFAYQFKPLIKFLASRNRSLLIADEVGLGKTIEAGLIWTEMRMRNNARRLLVLCPAVLCEKWQNELKTKFNVDAQIVNAEELADKISAIRQGTLTNCVLIGSYQGLRDTKDASISRVELHRILSLGGKEQEFDLIVADEAHSFRNQDSATYRLVEKLKEFCASLLLLSATPVQTKTENLFTLVHLLEPDTFAYNWVLEHELQYASQGVLLAGDVVSGQLTYDQYRTRLSALPNHRIVERLIDNIPSLENYARHNTKLDIAEQLLRISPLNSILSRTLKREVQENRVIRKPVCLRVEMNDVEKKFYNAIRRRIFETYRYSEKPSQLLTSMAERQMSSSLQASYLYWLEEPEAKQETDLESNEYLTEISEIVQSETPALREVLNTTVSLFPNARELLAHDSKLERLLKSLSQYWQQNPGKKVILFSFFKRTLRYLQENLSAYGIETAIYDGNVPMKDRTPLIERFKNGSIQVLLCSEAAAEGIDLQFVSHMINYDLPWNPAKIEQRIGRIDRIGQEEPRILIHNLVYADTVDDEIYSRLIERFHLMEQALGIAEEVLGELFQSLAQDLYSHELSSKERQDRIDQTALAIENQKRLEDQARNESITFDIFSAQAKEAMQLERFVTDMDIFNLVNEFFEREGSGCRLVIDNPETRLYLPVLSTKIRNDFAEFIKKTNDAGKTRLFETKPPKLLFKNKEGIQTGPDIEVVSQYHPIVRFIRAWLSERKEKAYKAVAVKLKLSDLNFGKDVAAIAAGDYVFDTRCFSFTGSTGLTNMSLGYRVKSLATGRFLDDAQAELLVNAASIYGKDWFTVKQEINPNDVLELYYDCNDALDYDSSAYVDKRTEADNDRVDFQIAQFVKEKQRLQERFEDQLFQLSLQSDHGVAGRRAALNKRHAEEIKRIDTRIEDIEYGRLKTKHHNEHVNCGVIRLEA